MPRPTSRPSPLTVLLLLVALSGPGIAYARSGWVGMLAYVVGAVATLAFAALVLLLVVRGLRRRLVSVLAAVVPTAPEGPA